MGIIFTGTLRHKTGADDNDAKIKIEQQKIVFFDIIGSYRIILDLYNNRKIYSWIADGGH